MNATKPLLFLSFLFLIFSCKKDTKQTKTDTPTPNAEFTHTIANLSEGRYALTGASSGDKIVFIGGVATASLGYYGSKSIDIYDATNNTWTSSQFDNGIRMWAGAGAGDQFVFAGEASGQTLASHDSSIYIFNAATNQWATTKPADKIGSSSAAIAAGNRIFFAGGMVSSGNGIFNYDDHMRVYDVSNNSWSTIQLSEGRWNLACAATGNIIMFGGGNTNTNLSSKVDIFNTTSNTRTTANLSEARYYLAAAAAGNKIVFAGGNTSRVGNTETSTVDIYDISTNSWTIAHLSEPRQLLEAAAAGNKIMFAGGYVYDKAKSAYIYSKTVDIYDTSTGKWSKTELTEAKNSFAAAASGNKIVFAGGINNTGGALKSVDIFTIK